MSSKSGKGTVAIIGSGPAGVFAAWALRNDGFQVTILEKEDHLTLDGHSYHHEGAVVSIPMRTFSGKYYANLFQTLKHLGIQTQIHRFHYVFTEHSTKYFEFFSNFHRSLPCFKHGVLLSLYLFLCYIWFIFATFVISPRIVNPDSRYAETETLEEYTRRIGLPDIFLDRYILPLFASVATCSHNDLRRFPAAYIINYKRGTFASHHHTVPDMGMLQDQLTEKVDKRFKSEVVSVMSQEGKVLVEYRRSGETLIVKEEFDHVIMATNAAAAYHIHKDSSPVTGKLLSRPVQVSVFQPPEKLTSLAQSGLSSEILMLETTKTSQGVTFTQSTHLHPSGVSVIVSPDTNGAMESQEGHLPLHTVSLFRPIPTPESHRLLLSVFAKEYKSFYGGWKNGDGNVYLVGGYASAGLPLLEACVRSGLEAAEGIGAKLPFDLVRKTAF